MKDWLNRHPVAAHFYASLIIASLVVAIGIIIMVVHPSSAAALGSLFLKVYSGPGYINIVSIAQEIPHNPSLINIFVFAAAPTIAALLLVRGGRHGGMKRLLSRFKPIGPDGELRRSMILYVGLIAIYFLGLFIFDWVAGPGVNAYARLEWLGLPIVFGALFGLLIDEGGTLEELGWRGFAWPSLLAAMKSPVTSALVLGVLHWAWHLPREVLSVMGGTPLTTLLIGQTIFLLLTISLAIVCGYCVNLTGGSVLPAIMVHGGTNVWSKAMGEYVSPSFGLIDLRTLIVFCLAVIILALARKNLGLKRS